MNDNIMKKRYKALSISYASYLVVLFFIIVMDTFINKDFNFIRVLIISAVYITLLTSYFTILFFVFKTGRGVKGVRSVEEGAVKKYDRKLTGGQPPSHTMKRYWIYVLIYIGLIFYLSSISDLPYVSKIAEMDPRKFSLHIIEYGIFSFLLYTAIRNTRSLHKWALVLTLVIGLVIGIFDELYQSYVPGRRFNPLDILSDEIGIIIGAVMAYIIRSRRLRSHPDNQPKDT